MQQKQLQIPLYVLGEVRYQKRIIQHCAIEYRQQIHLIISCLVCHTPTENQQILLNQHTNSVAQLLGIIMQTSRKECWPILSEESCRLADRNALAYPLERILQTRKTNALAHPFGRIMQIRRQNGLAHPLGLSSNSPFERNPEDQQIRMILPSFRRNPVDQQIRMLQPILSEESCRLADRNALAHLFEESCRLADTNAVAQLLGIIMQTSRNECYSPSFGKNHADQQKGMLAHPFGGIMQTSRQECSSLPFGENIADQKNKCSGTPFWENNADQKIRMVQPTLWANHQTYPLGGILQTSRYE